MAFVMATLITTIISIPTLSTIPYLFLLPFFVGEWRAGPP